MVGFLRQIRIIDKTCVLNVMTYFAIWSRVFSGFSSNTAEKHVCPRMHDVLQSLDEKRALANPAPAVSA